MTERMTWLLTNLGDALQDNVFLGVFATLLLLFALVALTRTRARLPVPWKEVGLTALIAPTVLVLGVLLGSDDGSFLGLPFLIAIVLGQLIWSVIRVVRNEAIRAPLASGFLVTWWMTLGTSGVALGLYSGIGRTWR